MVGPGPDRVRLSARVRFTDLPQAVPPIQIRTPVWQLLPPKETVELAMRRCHCRR